MKTRPGKSVSLVLGSGGARGLAHIGVIHWLNDNGYDIRSIAGSSMGALIGGIYAAGHLDDYERWVRALEKIDVVRLLDFSFEGNGLIKGDRVMNTLRDLIGEYRIEDLPLSFTAVATDVDEQREVWLNTGPLFDAIRASIAIPTIFTPVVYRDRLLLDGGLINPIPIAPTLRDKTDITIAVNVNGKTNPALASIPAPEVQETKNDESTGYRERISEFLDNLQDRLLTRDQDEADFMDIISQSIETMQSTITRFQMAAYSPDVVIEIPASAATVFEFYRAAEMIDLGKKATQQVMPSR